MQAYIDNLKATGQIEDGCILGLDGTAWTGGLAVTAEEGAAVGACSRRQKCHGVSLPLPPLLPLPSLKFDIYTATRARAQKPAQLCLWGLVGDELCGGLLRPK